MSHDLIWDGGGAGGTVPATPVVLTALRVTAPHPLIPQVPLLILPKPEPFNPHFPQEFLIIQYGIQFGPDVHDFQPPSAVLSSEPHPTA